MQNAATLPPPTDDPIVPPEMPSDPPALAAASAPLPDMPRPIKAAIIVRLLLSEGINLSLTTLPASLQAALARDLSTLRYVDRRTLCRVVEEFVQELDQIGLGAASHELRDDGVQLIIVGHAVGVGPKAWVLDEIVAADGSKQTLGHGLHGGR